MILLLHQRLLHLILTNSRAQRPQRRRQIHPALRLNRHLSSQRRAQLQIDLAQGCSRPQAVCFSGETYRAREGQAVVEGAGGAAGCSCRIAAGCGGGGGVGVVEVELVEDLVEVGGFLGR